MNVHLGVAVSVAARVETRDNRPVPQTPAQAAASARRRKPHTPARSIRVPDAEWEAAIEKAAERGETVTDAVRAFLRRYAKS